MRYMMIYSTVETGAPPTEREMVEMGAFIEEIASAGVLITTDGLKPSSAGVRVRQQGGKVTVIDGPFSESKEVVGGFAIVQVQSQAEAVSWAERFMKVAGDGQSEIREMYDAPAYPPAG